MRSRVMHLVASVCIYVCQRKNKLFSALPLEYLLLSVLCCLLLEFKRLWRSLIRPASCTDRAIHAFPNKTRRPPWPPEYCITVTQSIRVHQDAKAPLAPDILYYGTQSIRVHVAAVAFARAFVLHFTRFYYVDNNYRYRC